MNHNHTLDAETIAGGLQKAKRAGPGKYVACCPAHDDKTPSLSIKDAPSGIVLVKCWAGCGQEGVIEALRNLGLWHKPSRKRIEYLKRQSLKDEIWRNQMLLATATARADQGYVHSELERAQIKRAIHFLEKHGDG